MGSNVGIGMYVRNTIERVQFLKRKCLKDLFWVPFIYSNNSKGGRMQSSPLKGCERNESWEQLYLCHFCCCCCLLGFDVIFAWRFYAVFPYKKKSSKKTCSTTHEEKKNNGNKYLPNNSWCFLIRQFNEPRKIKITGYNLFYCAWKIRCPLLVLKHFHSREYDWNRDNREAHPVPEIVLFHNPIVCQCHN